MVMVYNAPDMPELFGQVVTYRYAQALSGMEVMFKRCGVWWTCIRYNGRKIQKSSQTSDKILAKVRVEIVEGKYYEKQTEASLCG